MKRIFSFLLAAVLTFGLVAAGTVPAMAESTFTASDECIQMLKDLEGFDKYPRWDYSQWTVGHGTRCPDEDLERYKENGITYEEADALLREYVDSFGKSVNSFIDKYSLNYNQSQFDALLMFTYNFGSAWMVKNGSFRTSLLEGATGNRFLYEIGQWCHVSDGSILTHLIKRRLMEANMFLNGVYSRTVPDNYCYVIYNFEGGDGETDVQCYDSNNPVAPYVIPERSGYTFAGWYTDKTSGTKVTQLDSAVRNLNLYARWVEGEDAPVEDDTPDNTVEDSTKIDPVKVTVQTDSVNIRKGPGTNYPTCGVVNKGKTMTITETKVATGYTWGKFDGGWIALCFTDFDTVTNETPPEETDPTDPPEETTPESTITGTVTAEGRLRIRKGPGTNYEVVDYVYTGDRVTILETKTVDSTEWGRIDKGWLMLSYVKLDPQTPSQPEKPTTPPEETDPTDPPEETTPESTITGTVKRTDLLRIRKGPGTNYAVVGYLSSETKVTILEIEGSWGRIDEGWISMDYVDLDREDENSADTWTGIVTADCLNVREGAGTNYKIVGRIYEGAKVTILETKGSWGRISTGWISLDYVKR